MMIMKIFLIFMIFMSVSSRRYRGYYNRKVFRGKSDISNTFLHHVGIGLYKRDVFCGGSLISHRHILSSAQCVYQYRIYMQDESLGVITGRKDLRTDKGTWYRIDQLLFHPSWTTQMMNYDISILKTNRMVELIPGSVDYITIPKEYSLPDDVNVSSCGWGLETSKYTPVLKTVNLVTVSSDVCKKSYGDTYKKMICTSGRSEMNSCDIDEGSGLIYNKYLIGILSFVGRECVGGSPLVFTDILGEFDWIYVNIQ